MLFTTLAFAHLLHHHFVHESVRSAGFLGAMALGVAIEILSFIGGCLLLRHGR